MTETLADRLEAATAIVEVASHIALRHRDRLGDLPVWSKGDNDPVSAADIEIEAFVRQSLRARFPQDGFVGEEDGGELLEQGTWALDPIDGTMNFVRGSPLWGISLGYMRHGVPLIGVVALPAMGQMVCGREDAGLFVNGRPALRHARGASTRVLSVGDSPSDDLEEMSALYRHLRQSGWIVECFRCTSLGLAFTAQGMVDGHIQHKTTLWDATAGAALCRAAGLGSTLVPNADGSSWMVRAGTPEAMSIA